LSTVQELTKEDWTLIGLRQNEGASEPRGEWFWVDKDGVPSLDMSLDSLWYGDEPNNRGAEDCGEMLILINDTFCGKPVRRHILVEEEV